MKKTETKRKGPLTIIHCGNLYGSDPMRKSLDANRKATASRLPDAYKLRLMDEMTNQQ